MSKDSSSASRRIDPEGLRRDYLFARAAIEGGYASPERVRPVYAGMDEEAAGRLGGRLLAAGVIDKNVKDELDRAVNRAMAEPLSDEELRGVDRLFKKIVQSKSAIDPEALSRVLVRQRKERSFRPLWEILGEEGLMEEVVARILEMRSRARHFLRELDELLGGAASRGEREERKDALAGRTMGKYRLAEFLGQGRLGPLYRARAAGDSEDVALRLLSQDEETTARLGRGREVIESVASLRHLNILGIQEVGYEKDYIYVASGLAGGPPLDRHVLAETPGLEAKLALVRDAARALDFAHRRGVLHRDLRPSNLFVTPGGKILLADFAFYRILGLEEDAATLPYRAPEELGAYGGKASDRTDVYSLGIVLYELLTGLVPVGGDDATRLARKIVQREDPDPGRHLERIDAGLASIVRRAIAPKPEARTESASAFAHEISRYLSPGSRIDLGPGTPSGSRARARRGIVKFVVAGALAAGIGGAAALLWRPGGSVPPSGGNGPGVSDAPDAAASLQRGRILHDRGDYPAALAALEEACAADPTSGEAHLERGRTLAALGRPGEAELAFEYAVQCAPDLAEARLRLAERLYASRHPEEAMVHLDEFLRRTPSSGVGYLLRGKAALSAGRWDPALADFAQASRLVPQDGESHLYAAVLSIRRGDLAGYNDYRKRLHPLIERKGAGALDLSEIEALLGDPVTAPLARGIFHGECASWKEAIAAFRQAASVAPGEEGPRYLLGSALLESKEMEEGSAEIYKAVVLALRARKYELSLQYLERLEAGLAVRGRGLVDVDETNQLLGEDDHALFAKGLYLNLCRDSTGALAAFDRCLEIAPDSWLKTRAEEYRNHLRPR